LPNKHGGEALVCKIGMDEAIQKIYQALIINTVSLDTDTAGKEILFSN